MGADGTIYIGSLDGKLYAIGDAWQQVNATSMNLVRGQIVGGGLSELHTSNDQYLQLRPGVTFSSSQRPIVLDLETTTPNSSPAGMQIVIESRASGNNIRQWVELYNFVTNQWVEVDSRVAPTTDVRIAIPVTNQAQFIEAGTRRMTARISYKAEGPVFAYPWTIRIDQATWNVR
jgi:hypothetical protein